MNLDIDQQLATLEGIELTDDQRLALDQVRTFAQKLSSDYDSLRTRYQTALEQNMNLMLAQGGNPEPAAQQQKQPDQPQVPTWEITTLD